MRYLSTKEIIKINAKVILRHSPGEMIGVKDANALDMAVKPAFTSSIQSRTLS